MISHILHKKTSSYLCLSVSVLEMKNASIKRRWWWLWWCFTIASNLAASLGDGTTSRLAVVVPHMQKEMKDIIHTFGNACR